MATKQKAVKPSSLDVKTICWLASKKAIMSVTPVGKTTMVYRLEYKGTYDISFSGVRARRKDYKVAEYDINIDISELKDRELMMLAASAPIMELFFTRKSTLVCICISRY